MSRALNPAVDEALAGANVPYLMFVFLDTDQPVRVCTAPYTVTWGGYDWLGAGLLGGISPVEEGVELQMYGVNLSLSGIPPEYVSTALGSHYQGRACKLWMAPLDASHQIVADPVLVFHGLLDVMAIEIGETATITVSAESRLTDWSRNQASRYTHEEQTALYPGDKGLEFVAKTAEMELKWGRA